MTINLASPQLTPDVWTSNAFNSALIDLPKLRFIANKGRSNIEHTRYHAQAMIQINKAFDFSSSPYWLDSLASSVLITIAIDKSIVCYLCLFLERTDNFHQIYIKYKICHLNIIIAQVVNRVSIFKTALTQIDKRKAKCIEQFKIIEAIKTNNLAIEEIVKSDEQELKNMTTSYTSNTGASILAITIKKPLRQVFFICNTPETAEQDNTDNEDKTAIKEVIINT